MKRFCLTFSVIIVLLCILKTSGAVQWSLDETTDEEYTYEDYEDDEESYTDLLDISLTTTKPSSELTTESKTIQVEAASVKDLQCPTNCKCTDGFHLVDCSYRNLMEIPKDLPYSTVQLNLSHNSLTKLDVNDLIKCTELRQIFLQVNRIETIVNPEKFASLPFLHHIDLSTNALKPLSGNEFSNAQSLAALLLTNNKNVVASNVPILQAPKLKTLNLANCSIDHLSNNTFENLSSLVALNLDDNPLDLTKSVNAFKFLIDLRTLSIPTVTPDKALDLCRNLDAIDIVHLSLETHEVSCYLLLSGSTYEESLIPSRRVSTETTTPSTEHFLENGNLTISSLNETTQDYSKTRTTYDHMCMIYIIMSAFALLLTGGILIAFCVIGSKRFGSEILYRNGNYRKYYPGNLTVDNQNYEGYTKEDLTPFSSSVVFDSISG